MRLRATWTTAWRAKRPWAVALLVAGLAGLAAAGASQAHPRECPGHWHSTFLVFMEGHRVHFDRPAFHGTPDGVHDYHMHADDQVLHYHPPFGKRCVSLQAFMGRLGIEVGEDSISFSDLFGGNQGTYRVDGERTLEVHYAEHGQPWQQVRWQDVALRQMRPGDRLLITYGVLTPELVASQQAQVRELGEAYLGPDAAT